MRTVLVTGGCGFIGSNFIRYLLQIHSHLSVINLDSLTYAGNPENLAALDGQARYRFVHGDITNVRAVRKAVKGVEAIFNFAAQSHVDRSIVNAQPFVMTNVVGTQVLLDAARAEGVKRFVQVSTDEVYGCLGPAGAFNEVSPLAPNNPYAASKAAADLLVRSYGQSYQVPVLVTRCSNNYGPFQFPEKLIPLFITRLLHDEPVPLYGDGLQIRDWIHVRDHCAAIDRVWGHGKVGEVYNIGGRCEKTNLELTHLLLEILHKPAALVRFVADRPAHDRRYAIDCTKIEAELNWRPAITFADGLLQTIRWYEDHAAWIAHVLRRAAGEPRREAPKKRRVAPPVRDC
jgi:dTDP-glucose 4,6-dehydratase